MDALFEPIKLRNKEVKNRLSKGASGETCASVDGYVIDVEVVAPSPVRNQASRIKPRELTTAEIEEIIQSYIDAAFRAEEANLDGVEIHGAHGYLVGSFMVERTNKRKDKYGGSFENRRPWQRVDIRILGFSNH